MPGTSHFDTFLPYMSCCRALQLITVEPSLFVRVSLMASPATDVTHTFRYQASAVYRPEQCEGSMTCPMLSDNVWPHENQGCLQSCTTGLQGLTTLVLRPVNVLADLSSFWGIYPKKPHPLPRNLHSKMFKPACLNESRIIGPFHFTCVHTYTLLLK